MEYDEEDFPIAYRAQCSPTAILHVNHESRSAGLKHYTLDFGNIHKRPHYTIICEPKIYINWKVDRIYLDKVEQLLIKDLYRRFVKKRLQFLAVNILNMQGPWDFICPPQLQDLVLFRNRRKIDRQRNVEFKEVVVGKPITQKQRRDGMMAWDDAVAY